MKRTKITSTEPVVEQTINGTDIAYEDTCIGDVLLIKGQRCTILESSDHSSSNRMLLNLQTETGNHNRNVPRKNLCHLIKRTQD